MVLPSCFEDVVRFFMRFVPVMIRGFGPKFDHEGVALVPGHSAEHPSRDRIGRRRMPEAGNAHPRKESACTPVP